MHHDVRRDFVLAALRAVSGLMLLQHGVQKHLGWLLPPDQPFKGAPEMWTQPWIAGTLEVTGGLLLAVGFLTRPIAFILSGLMAAAYFIAHAPNGFWPILNNGELAALYCFVFLTFSVLGPGRFSVDGLLHRLPESEGPVTRERPLQRVAQDSGEYPNDRRRRRRRRMFRV